MSEMGALNERLTELSEEIGSEEAKKTNFTKALMEKVSIGDSLDDKLRTLASKINQLEKIEYPGENERAMLVSLDGKFRPGHNFVVLPSCVPAASKFLFQIFRIIGKRVGRTETFT